MTQAITNPDRLITEQSMTPYSVECHRRGLLLMAYTQLQSKIEAILRDFHSKVWIIPRGIGKCPYRWEHVAYDNITEAFTDFEETVYDALEKFEDFALGPLLDLDYLVGFDDAEVDLIRKVDADMTRLCEIRSAFDADLNRLINPDIEDDDLPF